MLLVMFLHANRHNYSHLLERQPSDIAPRQVRSAEEFIEANWNEPISLEAIAAATEVSIRSLFRNFRQSRGYSPMEFLKQVRLRRAHELLERPNGATSVTEVAFHCGFGDLSRFSKYYFQAFGERPSDTLNRGRRGGPARN
jgi:transcriptional regulator GlxA family with amidase domain